VGADLQPLYFWDRGFESIFVSCVFCVLCREWPLLTSWSFVQTSPNGVCVHVYVCACVSVCDLETSMRRPSNDLVCYATEKNTE